MTALVPPLLPTTTLDRLRSALLAAACAYLLLLPTGMLSFWRSLAFATSAALAIAVAVLSRTSRDPVPSAGTGIPLTIAAWALWSAASLAWSVDRAFSAQEIKADIAWGLATMGIFYVATTATRNGFVVLAATMLAGLALWTALASGSALAAGRWDVRLLLRGEGAFATYLVTVSPFIALLLWPPPAGIGSRKGALFAAAALFALVLVAARVSDNRILWIAFAASVVIVAACARSRSARGWKASVAGLLLVVLALLFVDAARQRAALAPPTERSLGATLATDPRIAIWRHASERIGARPWHGYGYGLHILGREIGSDTGDAKIRHPHNLFVSQWLQTGAIGVALFVAMLGCVAYRFGRFVASRDVALSCFGALGLAVLAAFTIRNLTDDFFTRANGKLVFAACAILLGAGALRRRALARAEAAG